MLHEPLLSVSRVGGVILLLPPLWLWRGILIRLRLWLPRRSHVEWTQRLVRETIRVQPLVLGDGFRCEPAPLNACCVVFVTGRLVTTLQVINQHPGCTGTLLVLHQKFPVGFMLPFENVAAQRMADVPHILGFYVPSSRPVHFVDKRRRDMKTREATDFDCGVFAGLQELCLFRRDREGLVFESLG